MIVSINQPAYLPWAGYFDRIACSDLHVVLDHVQFEKNSLVNRNKIRTPQGSSYLTVPLQTKGRFGDLAISRLKTAQPEIWPRKHLNALKANYARAPQFGAHIGFFEDFYVRASARDAFLPTAMDSIAYTLRHLKIEAPLKFSSELEPTETKSGLVLKICRKLGATTYLSGPMGRGYLDLTSFEDAGIEVRFHDFSPQPYPQCWDGFESHMSIVDMLMNLDIAQITASMKAGRAISAT